MKTYINSVLRQLLILLNIITVKCDLHSKNISYYDNYLILTKNHWRNIYLLIQASSVLSIMKRKKFSIIFNFSLLNYNIRCRYRKDLETNLFLSCGCRKISLATPMNTIVCPKCDAESRSLLSRAILVYNLQIGPLSARRESIHRRFTHTRVINDRGDSD